MESKTAESCNLKRSLGFNLRDVINSKKQTVLGAIKDVFEGENMQTQYSVLSYRLDLYLQDYKLPEEVHELFHSDRRLIMEFKEKKQ